MTYQKVGRFAKKAAWFPFSMIAAIGRGVEGVRLYEALHRLSDSDLAAMGLARDGIARYVAQRMDPDTTSAGRTADVHTFAATVKGQSAANEAADQRRAA